MIRLWRYLIQAIAEFIGYRGELTSRDKITITVAIVIVILLAMLLIS